jgi:glycosyltransferase involved in cell wall biosynthesis
VLENSHPVGLDATHGISLQCTAVLGWRDEPTDAVEDYCRFLASALARRGCSLEIVRIPWAEKGWRRALRDFSKKTQCQRAPWALVQFTALSWSRHGFTHRFIFLIRFLKRSGMKVLIVFHDPDLFGGIRMRDRVRLRLQLFVFQRSARLADKVVTTISPACFPWMQDPSIRDKVTLVPVGSNVAVQTCLAKETGHVPTVIVFGVSGNHPAEVDLIGRTILGAAKSLGNVRLIVFGRGSERAEPLRERFRGTPIKFERFGVVSFDQAGALLAAADVQLFVRFAVSSRRGSAIAGIACGLPIVGFSGQDTGFPITEAGVRLVPFGDDQGLLRELLAVLRDDSLRETLAQRSRSAQQRYFSWERIADQYISAIGDTSHQEPGYVSIPVEQHDPL